MKSHNFYRIFNFQSLPLLPSLPPGQIYFHVYECFNHAMLNFPVFHAAAYIYFFHCCIPILFIGSGSCQVATVECANKMSIESCRMGNVTKVSSA